MSKIGKALCVLVCIAVIFTAAVHIVTREDKANKINTITTYDLTYINSYTEVEEKGVFCTKNEKTKWLEYAYNTENETKLHTKLLESAWVEIGNKNQIVIERYGAFSHHTLYVTLDTYKELFREE